jgi:4-hydroxybenzoyl-CoA thioesterase
MNSSIFTTAKRVRFHHCDPAGIVYYPRYYGLLHEAQEDFLAHIGFAEHRLIASGVGVPIVSMQTDFSGMSRYGDELFIAVGLWRLGVSSLGMYYEMHSVEPNKIAGLVPKFLYETPTDAAASLCGEAATLKLRAKSVVVHSSVPQGLPQRIPDDLRAALASHLLPFEPVLGRRSA